jgi:hypothetical protein
MQRLGSIPIEAKPREMSSFRFDIEFERKLKREIERFYSVKQKISMNRMFSSF